MMSRPFRAIDVHEATRWAQMRLSTMSDGALNQREREGDGDWELFRGSKHNGVSHPHLLITHARALQTHTHIHTLAHYKRRAFRFIWRTLSLPFSLYYTHTVLTEFHHRYSGVESFCLIIVGYNVQHCLEQITHMRYSPLQTRHIICYTQDHHIHIVAQKSICRLILKCIGFENISKWLLQTNERHFLKTNLPFLSHVCIFNNWCQCDVIVDKWRQFALNSQLS